ncbi:signal recognition particle-docking protein FtsY [Companilactobacillus nuruki]|uniref:Signal recognition particle receptor FtsY n=1 Tax=Companilactobacillus nuruki TaxID=1993540 RepID=A0A2N7AX94_9LACO|nr:signal recognition particle-docking protein FtsY [Companilactobacillus nuruki]PMD73462.1 signal recognition particle-docking protein FtsY [Companilactobacillus nuruki]
MGLFDRIKKAFTGKDDSEEKDLESKSQEETTQESDKTSETTEQTDETDVPKKSDEEISVESKVDDKDEEPVENSQVDEISEDTESDSSDLKQADETEFTEPIESSQGEPVSEIPESQQNETEDENSVEEPITEEPESKEPEPVDEENNEESTEDSEPKDDLKEYDEGLKKSRNSFGARFNRFLANFRSVDEDFFDDLEELLIESDVGYETAMRISDELREEVKLENAKKKSDVSNVIVKKLVDMYGEEGKEEDNSLKFSTDKTPTIFLFVGVNGAGKTTTVGKLAHRYQQQGKKVLLAAADTFRAGAIEQLQEWGKRDGVPVQASKAHTDPASVVYDAVERAIKEEFDVLLVDTAGRLQNKEGLMRELEKIKRVITRELPDAPQEVLLVLDGSTGQNALSQAKQFNETTKVSGIVLTKLDGSSQGGIVLAIRNELHIPVKLVGLGEQMDDLRDFDPEKFIYGLFKELIVGASNK